MRLSIIIPTLNEERYLLNLLASIRRQRFTGYEVIVSDGNSEDRTREIAQGFGCRLVLGPAKGPGYQRNRGAEMAQGNMLLFLDADTVLPDEEFLAKALDEFTQQGLVVASCYAKPREPALRYHALLACSNLFLRLIGGMILSRKKYHDTVGGFDEAPIIGEDTNYMKHLSRLGRFRVLESVHIVLSMRRFEQDGFFRMIAIGIAAELVRFFGGRPQYDQFGYQFGYFSNTGGDKARGRWRTYPGQRTDASRDGS